MRKSQCKVGTKVIRNNIQIEDSGEVKSGSVGTISRISEDGIIQVEWKRDAKETFRWWIDERCFDEYQPVTKEKAVLNKIKYLNEKYANRHINV
jgi:hypothetical protein